MAAGHRGDDALLAIVSAQPRRYQSVMHVKGTAYHARLKLLATRWEQERIEAFVADFQRRNPHFPTHVLPTSWLPMGPFLELIDEIVEKAYDGDVESLWEIGEASARWSMTEGPYKGLVGSKDLHRFASLAQVMFSNFFDLGAARGTYDGKCIDIRISGVPEAYHHPYFEYATIGYFRGGLRLLGFPFRTERILGFTKGDGEVHYRLHVQ